MGALICRTSAGVSMACAGQTAKILFMTIDPESWIVNQVIALFPMMVKSVSERLVNCNNGDLSMCTCSNMALWCWLGFWGLFGIVGTSMTATEIEAKGYSGQDWIHGWFSSF